MHGYAEKLLRVNLSTRKVTREPLDGEVIRDFIGGRGLGIKYLYQELSPHIDPLGEENKLIMLTGPLTGTPVQSVSRWLVSTKSPLTGCYARSSAGADFGAWLKFAGYDMVIIEGKSERPVYLYITSDSCQIEDAAELWGKETADTQEWLKGRYGKEVRTACIGPAGEKLVKYAAIVTDRRTASRCGVGTVMGSKGLKAVTIKARRNLNLFDPEGLKQLAKEQVTSLQANSFQQLFKEFGTTWAASAYNKLGAYPTRNSIYGRLKDYEPLSANEYKKLRVGEFGCYNCATRCGKIHAVPSGPYAGARSEGPEYESIWAFTGATENNYVEATIEADELCDNLGMDTISTGSTIGFAYELYEKGILTKQDTDGLELTWGNHAAMINLIKKIGKREGIGNLLAEGTKRAAEIIGKGADAYTIQIKGLELPAYEPRALKAMGFSYATSNIGGSHSYGYAHQELSGAVDRFAEEGKAEIVVFNQNGGALGETGIICSFAVGWGDWFPRLFNKMLVATTGIKEFAEWAYLAKAGERIVNLERAFNVREGLGRIEDTMPRRMLSEPLHTLGEPGEGQMVKTLDKFLDEYYQLRGWTQEGKPSPEKLIELGIGYVKKDMA